MKRRDFARSPINSHPRRGVVLVLVLVIVTLLSYSVYSFTERTLLEYTAVHSSHDHIQRRELAASAVELSKVAIHDPQTTGLHSGPVRLPKFSERGCSAAVIRRFPERGKPALFGLQDESARLNVNALPLESSDRDHSRDRLLVLPGMTVQIADAILDWMDCDDEPSEFGAESSWYTSQNPPYRPRQSRFEHLRELLLVRGITSDLLFGEDQNANGLLDPNEDDGSVTMPPDDENGILNRGWSEFLTLVSREGVLDADGIVKINLNQQDLAELYDELLPLLGPEMARYIVAMRMVEAKWPDDPSPDKVPGQPERQQEKAKLNLQNQPEFGSDDTDLNEVRGGIVLSSRPPQRIRSLVHLFGGQLRITIDEEDQILKSPWSSDPGVLSRQLPVVDQLLTTTEMTAIEGRINVNQASETVLNSIPPLTPAAARAIWRQQPAPEETPAEYDSVAWLVTRGILAPSDLRQIAEYVTVKGDVQGGIALGWYSDAEAVAAVQFVLDCSGFRHRLLLHRDLQVISRNRCGVNHHR